MPETKQLKFYPFLCTLLSLIIIIGLIAQYRLVSTGPIYFSATILVYPFVCFILDVIAEVYGYRYAKQSVWISIINLLIYSIVLSIISNLPSPNFFSAYTVNFNFIIHPLLRVTGVFILGVLAGQLVNIYFISKLKLYVNGRFFALRSIFSISLGEITTGLIILFGVFIGKLVVSKILAIFITEFTIMLVASFILAFFGSFFVFWLKKIEPLTENDRGINFNP